MKARPKFDPKRHEENPEWTARDFAKAKPASEVLPAEVIAQFKTAKAEPPEKGTLTKSPSKQRGR
jgi:predicted RNA-binding protein with PUA-like domain